MWGYHLWLLPRLKLGGLSRSLRWASSSSILSFSHAQGSEETMHCLHSLLRIRWEEALELRKCLALAPEASAWMAIQIDPSPSHA